MKQNKIAQEKFNQLHRQAEELMKGKDISSELAVSQDPLKLIHELQTFQIELELQNEELLRSQQALMESQNSYAQLYDFAPMGYISISLKGLILKPNWTFSDLLSMERSYLIKKPLSAHIMLFSCKAQLIKEPVMIDLVVQEVIK